MTDDNGNLSIDFLVGFTIFLLAFIWVVSMIPGLLIGLQSYTIDYDAVAYRTGVILVEDPGWPASGPAWESYKDPQKLSVTRFGLAISKDVPNILSQDKVNRFFCTTISNPAVGFAYPADYHKRVIFGDYPYRFNISLIDLERNEIRTVGDVLPEGYGYIRRGVKVKGTSNATINQSYIAAHHYSNTENTTTHIFSILINNTKLLEEVRSPAYQIDPTREQIMINITDLRSTINLNNPDGKAPQDVNISLTNITVYKPNDNPPYSLSFMRTFPEPNIDETAFRDINGSYSTLPEIKNNVSMIFSPPFFDEILKGGHQSLYVNLTFVLSNNCTFLNNTNARAPPFEYNYHPDNVTQPKLRDAVVEVAVW